jgi:hypothetical protein
MTACPLSPEPAATAGGRPEESKVVDGENGADHAADRPHVERAAGAASRRSPGRVPSTRAVGARGGTPAIAARVVGRYGGFGSRDSTRGVAASARREGMTCLAGLATTASLRRCVRFSSCGRAACGPLGGEREQRAGVRGGAEREQQWVRSTREHATIGDTARPLPLRWISGPPARRSPQSPVAWVGGVVAGQPRLCGAPCFWARRRRASAPWTARSSSLRRVSVGGRGPHIFARYRA